MKKIILRNLILSVLLTLSLTLFINGCSITDPTQDFEVTIGMPATGTVVYGQIMDVEGNSITDAVTVSIIGQDAPVIVDLFNEQMSTVTTNVGFLVLAVNDSVSPSADDPVNITLRVSAPNYITGFKNLVVSSTDDQSFEVTLLSRDFNDLPDGISGAEDTSGQSDNSGVVTNPVNLGSPPDPRTGASTSVRLNAGTRMLDGNGNPLTGNLTTSMLVIDLSSDTSGVADYFFPGGTEDIQTGNADEQVTPAVFTSISITDGAGRTARSFDPPLELTLQIPGDQINFNTGQPIANGDVITLFNFENGVWHDIGEAPVSGPDGNGNFSVTYLTASVTPVQALKGNSIINVLGGGGGGFMGGYLYHFNQILDLTLDIRNSQGFPKWISVQADLIPVSLQFGPFTSTILARTFRTPNINNEILRVRVYNNPPVNGGFGDMSPAGSGVFQISSPSAELVIDNYTPPVQTRTVEVHLFGLMPEGRDPSVIRPSGIAVQVKEAQGQRWTPAGVVDEGFISISGLRVGSSYVLKGIYTLNGEGRTAETPWERAITANTDTLHYEYQLSEEEANDWENAGG